VSAGSYAIAIRARPEGTVDSCEVRSVQIPVVGNVRAGWSTDGLANPRGDAAWPGGWPTETVGAWPRRGGPGAGTPSGVARR